MLLDTPMPPFLGSIRTVDFREHGEAGYRRALAELLSELLGRTDRRELPELAENIEVPEAPGPAALSSLRSGLVGWLEATLKRKAFRPAVADCLGLHKTAVEGYFSWAGAASAAVVQATGDDDPRAAALRIVEALAETFEDEDDGILGRLREALAELPTDDTEPGLLGAWLAKVASDHERLVPYFRERSELTLLDRVYVQLQLGAERPRAGGKDQDALRAHGPWSIRELLALEAEDHSWVSRRWVVLGDPGAGKTTLLRHLAAGVARQRPSPWVPVFESLSRLMREPEWLLDRLERQMKRAGEPAAGLAKVLDRAGQEGRLLLLLDGLDEVPQERRDETEALLRQLSSRWPETPLIVTSRPIGYRRPDSDFRELDLLPFGRAERREFLARWFGRDSGQPDRERADTAAAALEGDPSLRDLASNPLYLTLMALLIEQGTSPDRNRPRLYDQVFKLLLKGEHRSPATPMERPAAVRRMLRHLGYSMTEDNRDAEPAEALEDRLYRPEADKIREDLERVGRWRPRLSIFLDQLSKSSGILGPHDGPDADWRYWHRTFREALAAEALEDKLGTPGGRAAVLVQAGAVTVQDLSRWAEPYALLAGRVADPDDLVRALVKENRPLGLRALATAHGLKEETLDEILELSEEWQERVKVYERLPELIDEPLRALALIDRLRQRSRSGNDLFFLEAAARAVAQKWPDARRPSAQLCARFYDHVPAPPEDLFRWIETRDGRVELWREIPTGRFLMGSPEGEEGSYDDEQPQHEVVVRSPFRMAAVPVTVAQYAAFDPEHRSHHQDKVAGDRIALHPVEQVTWYQASAFCRWLASQFPWAEGARLPSEEEWEYACRAGTETRYWKGNKESDLRDAGWYDANSDERTHRVGHKSANPWGLYDVHGNVWEWTLSKWSDDYSGREAGVEIDPSTVELPAVARGDRVYRGGGYWNLARNARSAYRVGFDPLLTLRNQGFRVLLPALRGS